MKKYSLDFCFKGSRNYVHGTDIYNKLLETIDEDIAEGKIDLSFHGITFNNIDIYSEKPGDEGSLKFVFKYINKNDEKIILYGVENTTKVECRYKYPEEDICELSLINLEDKSVFLEKNTSYTFVENIVAINKYLLENLFTEVKGKWYFTRLQLNKKMIESIYPLNLKFKTNFNFKLTKTEIFLDNISVGFIYFSLV